MGSLPRSVYTRRRSILKSIKGEFCRDARCKRELINSHFSPETVLCLRAISKFETLYLSRASTRMTDSINSAFGGGYKQPPASREGDSVARVMLNEMDAARFDPLLGRSMARLLGKAIDAITGKVDGLVSLLRIAPKMHEDDLIYSRDLVGQRLFRDIAYRTSGKLCSGQQLCFGQLHVPHCLQHTESLYGIPFKSDGVVASASASQYKSLADICSH